MNRITVGMLLTLGLLAGCSGTEPVAERGAAALTEHLDSIAEVADRIAGKVGGCASPVAEEPARLGAFVGSDVAALYEPFVAEWATCSVSAEYPKVGLLLFTGAGQQEFQGSWRQAMKEGRIADGPAFAFGNGFAVSAGFLGVSALDLYYFRCDYADPAVPRLPSDVDGCVFADPEHGHGHH